MTSHAGNKSPAQDDRFFRSGDMKQLLEPREGPHVSIYMPTHVKGPELRQDPVRLKNLLREAGEQLERYAAAGTAGGGDLLAPAAGLLEDREFWQHRTEGMAIFAAGDFYRQFDLPVACGELASVTGHFHIKPLLRLIQEETRFFLLGLSQNATILYECDRYGARRRRIEGMPSSLEEALEAEGEEHEQQIQTHTTTPPTAPGGRAAAIYHGHGGGTDDVRPRLRRFCRAVDRPLVRELGPSGPPLVLAGVESLLAIYREASDYGRLLEEEVTGSPDGAGPKELHAAAWKIVRPRLKKQTGPAVERFRALSGAGSSLASSDTFQIVPATSRSQVECLLVDPEARVWGAFEPGGGRAEIHGTRRPGDVELADVAAIETLRHGGQVLAVSGEEMPSSSPMAAILRF